MKETVRDLLRRVHVALDEIPGASVDSDFMGDFDAEAVHALYIAATELSEELPDPLLMPKTLYKEAFEDTPTETYTVHVKNGDGTGALRLPADFLRLVRLHMATWAQDVRVLTDGASNEGRMQGSTWTRGTPQKPRAILSAGVVDDEGVMHRQLDYYTVGKVYDEGAEEYVFNHDVESFVYVPMPSLSDGCLEAGLSDRAVPLVVYRACAILMEGKQNTGMADRFRAMSMIQTRIPNQQAQ